MTDCSHRGGESLDLIITKEDGFYANWKWTNYLLRRVKQRSIYLDCSRIHIELFVGAVISVIVKFRFNRQATDHSPVFLTKSYILILSYKASASL